MGARSPEGRNGILKRKKLWFLQNEQCDFIETFWEEESWVNTTEEIELSELNQDLNQDPTATTETETEETETRGSGDEDEVAQTDDVAESDW